MTVQGSEDAACAKHTSLLTYLSKLVKLLKVLSRPLVLGKRESRHGDEWCVASEDCAFGPNGYERVRDVLPGEMVVITPSGQLVTRQCVSGQMCPCIFEYIYLARPDSVLNNISVYNFQLGLGTRLAQRIK